MNCKEKCLFPDYTKAQRIIELYKRIKCGFVTSRKEEAAK